jgi:DNA-binding response OmpR family regulator
MKRILSIEDDVWTGRRYSQKLVAEGFDVVIAEDGLVAALRPKGTPLCR